MGEAGYYTVKTKFSFEEQAKKTRNDLSYHPAKY